MLGIRIGNYHSYDDWGLILQSKEIQSPSPKTTQIEIEGGDGVLDLTEFFGDVKFNNRKLSFQFATQCISSEAYLALFSVVQDAIHGKMLNIILDDDPLHYYKGRATINEWKSSKRIGSIVIEVDAEPWKYVIDETVVSAAINGSRIFNLLNSRKRVVPTITTTASMTFAFGNYSRSVSAGTFRIPELELKEGSNTVTVTGTGAVTFRYQEGGL
jgi:hypothetical protein